MRHVAVSSPGVCMIWGVSDTLRWTSAAQWSTARSAMRGSPQSHRSHPTACRALLQQLHRRVDRLKVPGCHRHGQVPTSCKLGVLPQRGHGGGGRADVFPCMCKRKW